MSIYSPDLALRQPLTLSAAFLLFLSHYAHAVLTILPNTFLFRLLLAPFILWQAWECAVGSDFGAFLVPLLGHHGTDRFAFWNFFFAVAMFGVGLRTIEWTFLKKPFRRYEPPKRDQDTPIERPLSASTVFLDAFDLLHNLRGIGWSWSQNPFPPETRVERTQPSISLLLAKTLFELTVFDASQYFIQSVCPSVNNPKGGSIFNPNLALVPRTALAVLCSICSSAWVYTLLNSLYLILAFIGRTVFRQPASAWPRLFHRPWLTTSIQEVWTSRWHQLFRHFFIVFGARPGGAHFGKPGALVGAFAVSAILHHIGVWGMGNGTEFSTAGGFFLLMGIGAVMEIVFTRSTGLRVQGWIGWLWTMLWAVLWTPLMFDGWARHGAFATEFFPKGFRPGKVVVDAIVTLSSK